MLEAVRAVVGHLSRARLGPAELRPTDDQTLVQIYGRARRLLGYMQSASASYRDPVVIELGDDDQNLLASCLAMEIGIQAELIAGGGLTETRLAFCEQSRRRLSEWVLRFATRRLESIPGDANANCADVRALAREILEGLGLLAAPDVHFGATPSGLQEERERRSQRAGTTPAEASPLRIPRLLLDPRGVRHQSLRTLVALDHAAWERSLDARDLRMAAVHLRAVVEAVALDCALPRSLELGFVDPPETWGLTPLVLRLLPNLDPQDRGRLQFLDRCVALIRPGLQLGDPTPVTARVLAELVALAGRVFRELGVVGVSEPSSV